MLSAEKLKLSILQEAIQGRLVPQLEEEPAVEMEGIVPEEAPFAIPEKWKWVTLGEIALSISDGHHNPPPNAGSGIPVLSAKNINNDKLDLTKIDRWTTKEEWIKQNKRNNIEVEDILLVIVGATIGRVAIFDYCNPVMFQRSVCIIKCKKNIIISKYLFNVLKSLFIQKNIKLKSAGSAQKGIYLRTVSSLLIPLPPISEQKRIVAQLEEIMPLMEQYGESQTALMTVEQTLPEKLRASILQEAIKGKLVPQLEEEAAVELDGIPSEDAPFAIPANWKWVKLEKVGDWKSGNTPSRSRKDYYEGGNIPWLKTGDLNDGLIYSVPESITSLAHKEVGLRINPAGSVLIAMYGATIGKLGILAIPCTTNQACCACIINKNFTTSWWLFYYLLSQRKNFINLGAGGAQPNISKQKIINYLIPLPPLAEQKRIVERIQELLKHVDDLAGSCASQTHKS